MILVCNDNFGTYCIHPIVSPLTSLQQSKPPLLLDLFPGVLVDLVLGGHLMTTSTLWLFNIAMV